MLYSCLLAHPHELRLMSYYEKEKHERQNSYFFSQLMNYRLLLIHSSRINKAREKGVLKSFNIFLEDDLFAHLYAFSFLGKDKLNYSLSQSVQLIDDGWQVLYEGSPALLTKVLGTFLLATRLIFIWPIFFFKIKPNIIRSTDPQYSGLYSITIATCYLNSFKLR